MVIFRAVADSDVDACIHAVFSFHEIKKWGGLFVLQNVKQNPDTNMP